LKWFIYKQNNFDAESEIL